MILPGLYVLPGMQTETTQSLEPMAAARRATATRWPQLLHLKAFRIYCPSEVLFALIVAALWIALYNGDFWQRTVQAMWHPSLQGVLFLASLAVLTLVLQSILLLLAPTRRALRILASALFIVAAIGCYFVHTYGVVLNKDMLRNVVQTDAAEVGALLSPGLFLHVVIQGIFPALIVWRVNFPPLSWKSRLKQRSVFIAAALTISMVGVLAASSNYAVFFRQHKPVRYALVPLMPVASVIGLGADRMKGARRTTLTDMSGSIQRTAGASVVTGKPLVLFVVVGETARAANFQLGGYSRPTNPQLSRIENLAYFDRAASCATATAVSLPCLFSQFPRTSFDVDEAADYTNVLDSLVKGGFEVEWRDNNSGCKGVCARIPTIEYQAPQANNELCPNSYCFDEIMLTGLAEELRAVERDTAIVFHQVGSHGPAYSDRYPARFEWFTPVCKSNQLQTCKREQILNTYDNTIAYTDYFLSRQIELLRAVEDRIDSLLIYVSDHGESLGENGVYLHGMPYAFAPAAQKEVPMLIWASQAYAERTGLSLKCLRAAAAQRFSHDNLYHTVLGAARMRNALYDPKLDMLEACRTT